MRFLDTWARFCPDFISLKQDVNCELTLRRREGRRVILGAIKSAQIATTKCLNEVNDRAVTAFDNLDPPKKVFASPRPLRAQNRELFSYSELHCNHNILDVNC